MQLPRRPAIAAVLPKVALTKLREEVKVAKAVCPPFDLDACRASHLTPVYFGSALNNFGVLTSSNIEVRVSSVWPVRPRG
jgi:peptide subunit release factor RF-3